MSILLAHSLSKSYGENELMREISFKIENGDRIGLVGMNGTGKTTLFRIITGAEEPDSGQISFMRSGKLGYMEQVTDRGSETALEKTLTVFFPLMQMEQELEEIHRELEREPNQNLISKQLHLTEQFEREGGLTFRNRTRSALLGLGFMESELTLPMDSLSGGQRSKISLARLLLSGADLLLLDEPTNHLDICATEWLESFLLSYKGAVMLISHDRYFLDKVCNKIFELENQKLFCEHGNYSRYLSLKSMRQAAEEHAYVNLSRDIAKVMESVVKLKSFNREKSIRAAESKEKQIERMKENLVKPDAPAEDLHFSFSQNRQSGAMALSATGLSIRFEDRTLYENVDFEIMRAEHIFLIGANGCGKTTLLKQLLESGTGVTSGVNSEIGYYEQTQQNLDYNKNILDEIWDANRGLNQLAVRNALAVFLFKGDEVFQKIGTLSGGEKARVALVKLMLSGANMLILDEPTNHLDITARGALESALKSYPGTLLTVTHDRYLINQLATQVWMLTTDGLHKSVGNYDDFLARQTPEKEPTVKKEIGSGGRQYHEKKTLESLIRTTKTKLSKCEAMISEVEQKQRGIKEQLSCDEITADYQKVMELTEEMNQLTQKETELIDEWDALHQQLAELERG